MKILHREKVTAACGCTACVNLKTPQIHQIYQDKLIYFCNENCKTKFNEDPNKFLESSHFKIKFEELDNVEDRLEN